MRALRSLGLSLEEIAGVLADSADDLVAMRDLLTAQLRGLEQQAARIQQLTHQIRGLLGELATASMPDPDQFMTTLEMISVYEAAFTTEQREQLAQRRAELGPEAIEEARTEWAGLVEELLRHVQDDTPFDDPQVQSLVGRWDALGNQFHGEDAAGEQTKAAARAMWHANSEEIGQSLPQPVDRMRDLVSYLSEPGRPDSSSRWRRGAPVTSRCRLCGDPLHRRHHRSWIGPSNGGLGECRSGLAGNRAVRQDRRLAERLAASGTSATDGRHHAAAE